MLIISGGGGMFSPHIDLFYDDDIMIFNYADDNTIMCYDENIHTVIRVTFIS